MEDKLAFASDVLVEKAIACWMYFSHVIVVLLYIILLNYVSATYAWTTLGIWPVKILPQQFM